MLKILLLLLCSVSVISLGCNPAINAGDRHDEKPQEVYSESVESEAAETPVELAEVDAVQQVPEVKPEASGFPDPLAKAPGELLGASSCRTWLFVYGGSWCSYCRGDDPKIQAWANERGLTYSQANIPGADLVRVRFIDITRDKVERDLGFDGRDAMFPTYVIVDRNGRELWHHVGVIPIPYLSAVWRALNR